MLSDTCGKDEKYNILKILDEKPESNRPFGKPRHKYCVLLRWILKKYCMRKLAYLFSVLLG
jgi:hypothetical protein